MSVAHPTMRLKIRAVVGAVCILLVVPLAAWYFSGADLILMTTPYRGGEFMDTTGVTLQEDAWSCGVAVLDMYLDHSGATGVDSLLLGLVPTEKGLSMADLLETAQKAGVHAEAWAVASADVDRIPLPAIGLVLDEHFVFLERFDAEGNAILVDPTFGRIRIPRARFDRLWSGPAILTGSPIER